MLKVNVSLLVICDEPAVLELEKLTVPLLMMIELAAVAAPVNCRLVTAAIVKVGALLELLTMPVPLIEKSVPALLVVKE